MSLEVTDEGGVMGEGSASELRPVIPDRLFFRIGDVSEITGVQRYVLRYWEGEFPMLSPRKGSNGQRQYRRKDLETVLEIKRLLYDAGYTIAGAKKALKERSKQQKRAKVKRSSSGLFDDGANEQEDIQEIKRELRDILNLLD